MLKSAHELFQAGKLDQTQALCQEILKSAPQHLEAIYLLGALKMREERFDLAIEIMEQVLQFDPGNAVARKNRQLAAEMLDRKQIQAGLALCKQGAFSPAEDIFSTVLERDRDNIDALQLLGTIAIQTQRSGLAIEYFDRAIVLKSDYAEAHFERGIALTNLERFDEAHVSYERALAIKPDYAEAHFKRGIALRNLKRLDEALASYDSAIVLKPDYAEAHINKANALCGLKRLDEALASYYRAIVLRADYAEAHWNEALAHLLMGNFETGLQKYEWRWQRQDLYEGPRPYPQPLWLGDADLHGKRILLWSEQGFGDSIQFCRYVTQVAALGAAVILEAPAALAALLKKLTGVTEFVAKGGALPPFDFHCPLLSLPLAFKTTLDTLSGRPYLSAAPKRVAAWRKILGTSTRPRVGLAWSGSTTHKNDHNRSIPLPDFGKALVKSVDYIGLQKDLRTDDRAWLEQHPEIRSFDAMIKDFGDTAALIETLDLVITVDTSVAHLAGALGKEVWILLPFVPDWRWLLDRSDSPWYDSATLFRQPALGDWDSVLHEVGQRLAVRFRVVHPVVDPSARSPGDAAKIPNG